MGKKKPDDIQGLSLEAYVQQTCLSIVKGVALAQKDDVAGAYIGRVSESATKDEAGNRITDIQFSIVSEVSTNKDGGLELTVPVLTAKLSAGGKMVSENKILNTLKFSVPIAFPKPVGQKDEEKELANLQATSSDLEVPDYGAV